MTRFPFQKPVENLTLSERSHLDQTARVPRRLTARAEAVGHHPGGKRWAALHPKHGRACAFVTAKVTTREPPSATRVPSSFQRPGGFGPVDHLILACSWTAVCTLSPGTATNVA